MNRMWWCPLELELQVAVGVVVMFEGQWCVVPVVGVTWCCQYWIELEVVVERLGNLALVECLVEVGCCE